MGAARSLSPAVAHLVQLKEGEGADADSDVVRTDFSAADSDNEQWFMALRKRNVPVELVRYPRSGHISGAPASRGCSWIASNGSQWFPGTG